MPSNVVQCYPTNISSHLITFNVIKPTINNILLQNQHWITLNVIEPAAANVTDAGSITFDHI